MFSFKANNRIWSATVAALTVLCLAVSIWAAALLMPADIFRTASAANTVTNTTGSAVGLDELCRRYNVEYIYVPGGKNGTYWQNHIELQEYGFSEIFDSESGLRIENNVLYGWSSERVATQRSLVVVPKRVKSVVRDGSNNYIHNLWNSNAVSNQSFVGIAFEEDSALIEIGNNAFNSCDNLCFGILPQKTAGQTGNITIGTSAFSGTASLRTVVLPERVTTIGANAFENAYNLYHISIPSTVASIGVDAFKNAYALCDVEVNSNDIDATPFKYAMNIYGSSTKISNKTKSWLYTTDSVDNLVFSFNSRIPASTVLATISGNNSNYKNGWYFITLGGPEDKAISGGGGTTQYVFPDELELAAQRNNIDWDYIDSAGKKVLNTFTGDNVTEYDINIGACHNLYFSNVILSNAVSVIGDYAFRYSHVTHAEISSSVTHIGKEAFRGTGAATNQLYYIKKTAGKTLNIGTNAFQMAMGWGNPVVTTGSRKFIFSNQKAYSEENSASKYNGIGDYNVTFTYLVPVKTNVDDGGTVTTEIDSYRLAGSGSYNYTLDGNGYSWSDKSNVAMPNIEGNDSTVWYTNDTYETKAEVSAINTSLEAYTVSEINLYTKKIAAPTIDVKSYEFSESLNETFYAALGLTEDGDFSTAEQARLVDFNGGVSYPSNIHNAGVYTISVNLNPKWGEWNASFTKDVTVSQAKINLGKISNLPKWSADGGSELGGSGDGVPLYRYGNEWYLYQQAGLAPDFTSSSVVNSYVRYTGSAITVVPTSGSYANYIISASGEHSATNSGEYYSSFTFSFDPNAAPNYIFTKEDAETAQLNLNGVTVTLTGTASAQVSKHWYIVKQQNWFIDETAGEGDTDNFVIATRNSVATTNWEYEATDITVHIPKLANNDPVNPVEITFTMSYGSTLITGGDTPVAQLPNYINSAMPAGVYTVIISAGAVGSFPAISERIIISVNENDLDLTDIHSTLKGKSFEHVWNNGNLYLHDDITSLIENLNGKLNTVWKNLPANTANIWKAHSEYYNDVAIAYNLDRMQSSTYYTADEMASRSDVPKAVGQYNVYYSLSALNYNTVGGTNDTHRRDYIFNTVIYRELSANNLISSSQLTYTGGVLHPAVAYSQYYDYAFNDEGYINVGTYTVTITISDKKLSRWNTVSLPDNVIVNDGVATVTFKIIKADNGWTSVPQIPSWNYNGFDADTYTINALHNFENENLTVYFGIQNGSGEWVELGEYGLNTDGSNGGNYFNVDENGKVDANIAAILRYLKPDTYYLVSYITGNDNINPYITSQSNYNKIIILKAVNRWTTAPNIISWTWGRYDPDVNRILAEAEYPAIWGNSVPEGLTVPEIEFSIRYFGGGTIDAKLEKFTVVTDEIATILGKLPVGKYSLITNLGGTDYYGEMKEQITDFVVLRATNYWNGTPNVTAWKWSEYDKTTNTIVATPAYAKGHDGSYGVKEEADPVVKFTILKLVDGEYVLAHSALLNFTATNGIVEDAVAEALGSLDAGTYYLVSSMEGKTNYTAINESAVDYDFSDASKNATLAATSTTLIIGKTANSWDVTPGIVSWDYKNFVLSNFTQGEPKFTVADSVVSYAIYKKAEETSGARKRAAASEITVSGVRYILIGEYTTAEELEAAVKNLSVNDYVMRATYKGTDNYEPLSRDGQFSVTKANNRWTVTPVAYSYTYGTFTVQPDDQYGWLVPVAAHGTVKFRIEGTDFDNNPVSREYATSQELIAALKSKEYGLNAGTYSLIMSVDGTDDFGDITERTTAFNVNRVTSVWTNGEPKTAYSRAYSVLQSDESYKNVIKPESNSSATVTFTVYAVNGGTVIEAFGFDEISAKIKTLTPGTYSIATRFAEVCNYTLLEAYTTLEITRKDNRWLNLNYGIVLGDMTVIATGTWNNGNNLFAKDAWLKIVPLSETSEGKGDTVRYTIGNDTVNVYTYAELQAKAKEFAAGTYVITAFVGQSNEYNALSSTFRIEIEKCNNSWNDGWTLANSLVNADDGAQSPISKWTWTDKINWLNGVPVYGNLIYVSIINTKDNSVVHYITIDYSSENAATTVASVGTALTSLDAGGYVIRVTAPADTNWNELSAPDYSFSIVQIINEWDVYPHIDGDGWVFGSVHSGPKAEPKYGSANDVKFMYAPYYEGAEDDNYSKCNWSSEQPSSVGKYVLSGSLSLSGNYTGLSGYSIFNIIAAENRWVSSPNVTDWFWDGYSKANNLFIASARSGGTVTFGIYLSKTGDNYNSLTGANFYSLSGTVTITEIELALLENIKIDENGIIIDNANGDLVKLLNALRPGTYILKADAEAGNNYGPISGDTTFTVTTANNDWSTLPSVANYIYNRLGNSFTAGVTNYTATIYYKLSGSDNDGNAVSFDKLTAEELAVKLATLNAGANYNLYAWAESGATFNAVARYSTSFQVLRAENDWANGHELAASLTVPYVTLHGGNYTIENLFAARPWVLNSTNENDGIIYTVLNDNGSNHFENLKYDELLANLRNLDSGSYSIRVTAAQSCNYNAISKDIRFSITRAANVFTGLPGQIKTTWNPDGNEIPTHEIKATSGADSIKFTLNGETFATYAAMQNSETLKKLNAGTYTVTVSVAQSNSYVAITDTFDIVIGKIDNGIEGNWDIEDSLSRKDGEAFTNGLRWYWKTDIAWAYGVPVYGQIAYVTIAQSLSSDPLHYISIDYRTTNGIASAVQTVEAAIKALDAGNYVIMLTVPEDVNWNAMNVYAEFTVSQAVNDWAKDGAPYIGSWAFGADHPLPSATPLYGNSNDVKFMYAPYYEGAEEDNYSKCSWSSEQPSAAGNYVLMATLKGTNNYSGISGYYRFTITNATNNWVKLPGAMPWNWNGYDKETILFFGSARSGGTVTFGIYASVTETIENEDGTDKVIKTYNVLTDKNFYSQEDGFAVTDADIAKLVSFTLDGNGQVSDDIANLLKALRPGTYVLKADAAALNSYAALSSDVPLTVGIAANGWATRPSVANYIYKNVGNSFTAGVPVYAADVHYVLDGYETEKDSLTAAELGNILETLATGNYSISVWVDAGTTFSAYYSAEEAYTINFRVLSAENGWENEPSDSLKVLYTTLHGEGYTLDQLFGTEPSVLSGSALYYTIMNEDGSTTTYVDLTYGEDLFNALLNLNSNSYIIRVSAGQSDSFGGISKNVRLTIMRNKNAFKNENMLLPIITWWEKDGNVIEDRLIEADFGTENMTFVLNAITYNSYEELKAAAASLDAGRYNLTVSIAQTNEYEGLSEIISLVIEAGTNSWQDGWTINSSILMNNGDNDVTVAYWNWSSVVKWSGARPQYGNLVYVIISEKDTATVLHYITLDYSNDGYANAIASVGTALSALDKGDYEITVTAPADNNWKVLSHSFDFSVNQTGNGWTEDGSPAMSLENWVYNTQSGTPSASAKYGSTIIKYYIYDAQTQTRRLYGNQIPTDAGTYSVGFSVKSSDNYAGIDEEFIEFTINKAQNTSFMVTPGAVGWTWNEYKRTVNLFSGIPTTGGKVTFSVLLNGEVVEVDGTALENISLVSITGIHTGDLSRDLYVSTRIGGLLAKLLANSYTLRVTVDETENYEGFYVDVSFAVTAVVNEWTTIPQVKAWAVNVWTPESTPRAVPRYGVAHISIVSTAGTRVYYEAIYDSATGETTLVNNNNYLQSAPAGSYTLIATVPAAPGCYENALEAHVEFQIFVEGSTTQSNYWRISPSIEDWRANSDGEYNVPVGEPLRGTAYFTFYKRERIDGQYVVGEKITEKDGTAVTVEGPYGYTYYIPVEPGLYFMEAVGISRDNFGEIIESDSPTTMWVRFEIYKRENRFTEDPRIADTLYLGERDSWAKPTAAVLEGTVTYSYRLWGSSDEYVYEIPNLPGVYELRATGSALYADDIYKSVKFEVKLSPNSWISSPTIKDGSEETGLDDPFGEALVGNEYIEYMYAYADTPDVKFKTKPTQEGTYIVYATLELDGYETLTHEWTFTISPAYDRQLLTLDIVLGTVACAVAGVAIYFAVRRYKENG